MTLSKSRDSAAHNSCTAAPGSLYCRAFTAKEGVRINTTEEQNMRRIKTLTRPKVNYALVHQGVVLTILEKQLRDMLSNLRETMDKTDA